jgi:Na+/H+ antiporter NhaD/arsenite permease-like protein
MSLAGTTALLSAFLDNLTTILLIAPITFLLADALDIDAVPLLIIEVIASIIAGATGLSFNAFIVNLAPVVVVTFAAVIPLLYLFFRDRLRVEERNRRAVMELNALASIRDSAELRRTGPVLPATRCSSWSARWRRPARSAMSPTRSRTSPAPS